MKKTFLVLLISILSAVSHGQVLQSEKIGGLSPIVTDWSATACYFKGYTYIFVPYTVLDPAANAIGNSIFCRLLFLNSSDSVEVYYPNDITQPNISDFPRIYNSPVIPAACVFKGKLYLFYTTHTNKLKYTCTDGTTWSEPAFIEDYRATGISMSASVLGNKLYLVRQNNDLTVQMINTRNGEDWNAPNQLYTAADVENKNVSISTCTFNTPDNKPHILIAVNPENSYVTTNWFDNENGYYNYQGVSGAVGRSVHLIAGSLNNILTSDQYANVQIFIRGTDNSLWHAQYYPDTEYMSEVKNTFYLPGMSYTPCVFPLYRINNKDALIKRIAAGYAKVHGINYNLDFVHFDSDRLKRVPAEDEVETCDNHKELWKLIGVVDGPVPFVLNGTDPADFDVNDPLTMFTYGTSESNEVVTSGQWEVSTTVSLEGTYADVLSAGVEVSAAFSELTSTTKNFSFDNSRSVIPSQDALGYYYFLKPTITRYKYELKNYNNVSTGQFQYVFDITSTSLVALEYTLTDVDPFDIDNYNKGRERPDPVHPRLATLGFDWTRGSPYESNFSQTTAEENTGESTMSITANMGIEGIFDMSAGYEVTLTETHKTSFGETVSLYINNPYPDSNNPEHVRSYSGTAYWLKSNSKNDYWIPTDLEGHNYNDQRPWLLTYYVSNVEHVGDPTDVKEDSAIPDEFSLDQNYPNPFNPATTIEYSIPERSFVNLTVYNSLGQKVAVLVNRQVTPGNYSVNFNGSHNPSGVYYYRINNGSNVITRKMMLLK